MSSGGPTDASTFAPRIEPGKTAPTRPLDRANSVATATGRSKVPSSDAVEAAQRTPMPPGGGVACRQWDRRARQAGGASRKHASGLLEEAEQETGSSYEPTVWRKLEDGTRKAYAGALHKL